jgi:hypothetical protein
MFRKSIEKIQVSLKSDKNNGCCPWRPIYILIVSRSFALRMWNIFDNICRENKKNILFSLTLFFSKIVRFMRQCGRLGYSRTGHWWHYDICELHAGYRRLQNTRILCNTFSPFHDKNCYSNAPQYYIIHTLPVSSYISLEHLLHQETWVFWWPS